jgi:nicotinamide-nucleotide amidase
VNTAEILRALEVKSWSLGLAESLTGGLLADAFVQVPGASKVLRGSVVAYATDLKAELLGVDGDLLAEVGAVDAEVALAMAAGAANRLGASVGLATTGVAGPDSQDGKAVGTVFVAVVTPDGADVEELAISGDREAIRHGSVEAAVALLAKVLR